MAVQAVWPLCGAEPALRVVQVPGFAARSHASHVPVQALSQQTPSGEQVVPLAQSVAADWQPWPFFFLQTPEASQVPAHTLFGSSWFLAATQVWSDPQVMQVPVQSDAAQQPTGGGFSGSFKDLFGGIFSGGQKSRGPRPGSDLEYQVNVDFWSAVRGGVVRLEIQRQETCPGCKGKSTSPGTNGTRLVKATSPARTPDTASTPGIVRTRFSDEMPVGMNPFCDVRA